MAGITLLLAGRAMTLSYVLQAGGPSPTDPPAAWLMPLIGDAIIGVSAIWVAYLLIKESGLWVWAVVLVWNAIAIWDAMSAFVISTTNPWPDFFMLQTFGPSMFFIASLMHLAVIIMATLPSVKQQLIGYSTAS